MSETLETIDSQEAISATLETFLDTRSTLSIAPPSIKDFFSSFILKINNDRLIIDQVIPKTGNVLLKPGQPLSVRISHKSTSYRFESHHIAYSIDNSGSPHHEITLPTQIQYLEKRSGYRIHPKLAESQPIKIAIPSVDFCEAELENISHGGACIRIKGNHLPLEACDVIDCNIEIASSTSLACKAVIKHYHYSPQTDETKTGVEFCQLNFPAEKQLHRMLMKLQQHNTQTGLTI
jgi:c-di-GMP-binding flagellar brake protein YcgR